MGPGEITMEVSWVGPGEITMEVGGRVQVR